MICNTSAQTTDCRASDGSDKTYSMYMTIEQLAPIEPSESAVEGKNRKRHQEPMTARKTDKYRTAPCKAPTVQHRLQGSIPSAFRGLGCFALPAVGTTSCYPTKDRPGIPAETSSLNLEIHRFLSAHTLGNLTILLFDVDQYSLSA